MIYQRCETLFGLLPHLRSTARPEFVAVEREDALTSSFRRHAYSIIETLHERRKGRVLERAGSRVHARARERGQTHKLNSALG